MQNTSTRKYLRHNNKVLFQNHPRIFFSKMFWICQKRINLHLLPFYDSKSLLFSSMMWVVLLMVDGKFIKLYQKWRNPNLQLFLKNRFRILYTSEKSFKYFSTICRSPFDKVAVESHFYCHPCMTPISIK